MKQILLRNGKTLVEAIEKISEHKKPTKFLQDKYPYYKIGEYQLRLEEAFGKGGYEAIYSGFAMQVLPCVDEVVNQVLVTCECVISVYADDGNVVLRASGIGTKEVVRDKDAKTQYQMLNNIGLFVQQAAFKSAAKSLNIFDCNRYDEEGTDHDRNCFLQNQTEQVQRSFTAAANTTGKKKEFIISFLKQKPLEKIREDSQTHLPVYRMVANEVVGSSFREKESEVILYPNMYRKETDKMNQLVAHSGTTKITIKVSAGECTDRNRFENTYIFKGFGG